MIKRDVDLGGVYLAKVSNKTVKVRIARTSPNGGWFATNMETGREVRVRTAARLTQIDRGGPWTSPA